jgi:hypothetical protein
MWQLSPRDDRSHEPLMRRLDRAAGEVNPFLIVLVIGLAILDLTCFVALQVSELPATQTNPGTSISASPTVRGLGAAAPRWQ